MPAYKCDKCQITDDEAVPCPKHGRMLLPVEEEKIPRKVVKKVVKK